MKKLNKKILAIAMAAVMLFAVGVTAMAAQNNEPAVQSTIRVTVKVREQGALLGTTFADVPAGSSVYDVIDTLSKAKDPLVHNAGWSDPEILDANFQPTGTYGKALVALTTTVNGSVAGSKVSTTRGSNGVSTVYADYSGSYTGSAWVYKVGNVSPADYMDQYTLNSAATITLDYVTSTETW